MDERNFGGGKSAFPSLTEGDDLSGFWAAMLAQHRDRCLALKRVVDDDLADMITARRLEVEGIVHGLRRSCAARLIEGLEANRRVEERQKRACEAEVQEVFSALLEDALRLRLEDFRRSPEYRDVMEALAAEALKALPSPLAILVEKGDGGVLSPGGVFREIREELEGVWGGLILVGEGQVVDNTFRTRWRRLRSSFTSILAESLGGLASHEEFCV